MKRTLSRPDPYFPVGADYDRQQHDRLLLATTVRMARAALGWSQAEFGRCLGMSQRAIHRIEQGHSEPRQTTLLAIESLLRKAGFKIQDRPDGGFSMGVPGAMLTELAQPVDVAAPSLADPWLHDTEDESEATERAAH